jgi:hypothetical protein
MRFHFKLNMIPCVKRNGSKCFSTLKVENYPTYTVRRSANLRHSPHYPPLICLAVTVPRIFLPSVQVMRSQNWGFLLQSCWGILLSYPIPLPGVDLVLEKQCELITTADQVRQFRQRTHRLPPLPPRLPRRPD